MKKMLSFMGILGAIFVATDENTKKEFSKIWSSFNTTKKGITSGMDKINKTISELANSNRISFKLGDNQISINDLYAYFYDKVVSVWNSGEVFKVILSMVMLVLGVISLIISPIISIVLYVKNGIKDKSNFINDLRGFLLQVGIEASLGTILVLFFVKIISL